jgi:N-acetylneuraminic acid mutarotase
MDRREFLGAFSALWWQTPHSSDAEWTSLSDMPVGRSEMPAATLDGLVYVLGGFGAGRLAHRYDPEGDEWTQLADLRVDTNHLGMAAVEDRIVAAGGYGPDGSTAHDGMWAYQPDRNAWEEIGRLSEPIGAFGLAAVENELYLVGGALDFLGGTPSAKTWHWDTGTGTWEERAPISAAREHLAVVSDGAAIYAIGGRAQGGDERQLGGMLERYDPKADAWELLAPLPVPRSGLNGAALCNGIAVAGGEASTGVFDDVNFYAPAEDAWQALPPLPKAVHGVAIAAAGESLLAIGGSTVAGQVKNVATTVALPLAEAGLDCEGYEAVLRQYKTFAQ